jgi:hypothetical protein
MVTAATPEIEDLSLSVVRSNEIYMGQILEQDPEAWSSLRGIMATLALPSLRYPGGVVRRKTVEIELVPFSDTWVEIDAVIIEAERVTFTFGVNGHSQQYVFNRAESLPRWRPA